MKTVIGLLVIVFSLCFSVTGLSAEMTLPESKTEISQVQATAVFDVMTASVVYVVDVGKDTRYSNCTDPFSSAMKVASDKEMSVGWRMYCASYLYNIKERIIEHRHTVRARDKIRFI